MVTTGAGAEREKACVCCGRRIVWRKKWERDWESVRYCSEKCRRTRMDETDLALEEAIVSLLRGRAGGGTICPSEAARAVAGDDDAEAWRAMMERTRMAARRLVASKKVVMMQQGRVVDPSSARGPVRIRLK
ncbi:MAG: DUF2256 and DUF3253 domain-containing protein [Phycisphaeraceae bacterium]|nr:MAG: DUF2256 and DUF3253 domain-containing protein [Phycisphaeraceae bacterium]